MTRRLAVNSGTASRSSWTLRSKISFFTSFLAKILWFPYRFHNSFKRILWLNRWRWTAAAASILDETIISQFLAALMSSGSKCCVYPVVRVCTIFIRCRWEVEIYFSGGSVLLPEPTNSVTDEFHLYSLGNRSNRRDEILNVTWVFVVVVNQVNSFTKLTNQTCSAPKVP